MQGGHVSTYGGVKNRIQAVLEKAEEPEIKLPTSAGSSKKQENSRKNLLLFY